MVMIDSEKWKKSTNEQKLQMCQSLAAYANERAISKDDYIMMFKFLLSIVKGVQG